MTMSRNEQEPMSLSRLGRMTKAVAAWLNFERLCYREKLFSEYYMRFPIGQFLTARFSAGVRSEYKHKALDLGRRGRKPCIDYAVKIGSKVVLGVETKWIGDVNSTARDIMRDIVRLELFANDTGARAALIVAGTKKKV